MAHGQNQRRGGNISPGGLHAAELSVFPDQSGEAGVEAHLAAQLMDLAPDGLDHTPQQIGAHMGLLPVGDLGRCAVAQQGLGHKTAQLVVDAGGELTVGKGARAALAKLDVGVGVQLAGGEKVLHCLDPLLQSRTTLQHDGPVPRPGQCQRGEQACRTEAAHHRAAAQWRFGDFRPECHLLGYSNAGRGPGQGRFRTLVFQGDGDGIHQHGLAVPGIHRKLCHPRAGHLAFRQAQGFQGHGFGLLLGLGHVQPHPKPSNQQHLF